ncbi:MAG: hypothetical protein VXU50_05180 [Verrucomicrobiota bacterium]|jgi:mRNA-degrading endonuclease YafQ of YafQ-DinJ toxin-antitoxin module|nr:hypothetical protein [Verrucomicrobiota bacterium]
MGFDWNVNISLHYCVPIKLDDKVSIWYMLKRLAEYEPGYAKRAHQAMLTNDPMGALLLKKAAQSVIVLTDSAEYDENEVEKEVEKPTPLEARFHYHPRLGECEGCRECELEYNPEILQEAFEYAASKILGDGHGISLEFMRGGAYGDADACAKEKALFMTYKPLTRFPEGEGTEAGRGGSNIPWGVYSMAFPTAPPGVVQNMHRLTSAFGYTPDGEVGWRVITVADGG